MEWIYPQEVDFYLPKYKLAIEVNPEFTHNLGSQSGRYGLEEALDYHYNKFIQCKNKDVDLLNVFDWYDLNMIKRIIERRIYSGKVYNDVKVDLVNLEDFHKEFIQNYEINIKGLSDKVFETHYGDDLVGVICFKEFSEYIELTKIALMKEVPPK